MAREKKVVDASVIVKVFLHEEGDERAQALIQEHARGELLIIIPDLVFIEVLNALCYKHKNKDALEKANQFLWDLQFHVERTNSFLLKKASSLALEWNLSLYDALYLALAQNFGVALITADKVLAKVKGVSLL